MVHCGFLGGFNMFGLGTVPDMLCFFSIIEKNKNDLEYPQIFLDRLFRRYVCIKDVGKIEEMLPLLKVLFSKIDVKNIKGFGWQGAETMLDLSHKNLLGVFERYFYAIEKCIEAVRLESEGCEKYRPLRTGIVDIPGYIYDDMRPLAEFDDLGSQDMPFWIRYYYEQQRNGQ
jgi:hypothetical protein